MRGKNRLAAPRLLEGPDDIDTEWLGSVLRIAGQEGELTGFTTRPIGSGNVSETVRVALTYSDAPDAPASLVCKFRAADAEANAHGVASGSYAREVGSYRTIGDVCRTPGVLWVDGGISNINLVMEDLTGARAGDQIAGCSRADAAAVLQELALLHRSFHPMTVSDTPPWSMVMADTAPYWLSAIERALPVLQSEVFDRLESSEKAGILAASAVAAEWYKAPLDRATLTHGDPRVDNVLFIDDGAEGKVQAVLIDWQLTGRRNPMHDVGYFLSGSLSVEDRRSSERELLRGYGEIFGPAYPLAHIERDYRRHLLSGLFTTVAAYGLIPLTPAVDALLLTLIRRNVAAALDWQSAAAISKQP